MSTERPMKRIPIAAAEAQLTAKDKRIAELEGERDAVLAEYELIPAAELNATVKRLVAEAANSQAQLTALRSLVTEAASAWSEAYPESDEDNSDENLWARYGSEFAFAMRKTRALLTRLNEALHP